MFLNSAKLPFLTAERWGWTRARLLIRLGCTGSRSSSRHCSASSGPGQLHWEDRDVPSTTAFPPQRRSAPSHWVFWTTETEQNIIKICAYSSFNNSISLNNQSLVSSHINALAFNRCGLRSFPISFCCMHRNVLWFNEHQSVPCKTFKPSASLKQCAALSHIIANARK